MTSGNSMDEAQRLFSRALRMNPEQREQFLDDTCRERPDLKEEVLSLLQHADDRPPGLVGQLWSETEQSTVARSADAEGSVDGESQLIGNYRILEKIGEGGMGEVYLAEQEDPRRKVALKIIKWGMDTKQVIARFEAERQALALMDHPCIAKVFDAGATATGRPYFVMEYVKGVSITEHCDRHRLTTHERLELFNRVCEGVQHAHQKAVIHRDIKPSNVLVTLQGDKPMPKIIDFGVAKATAQRLTEKTMFTAMGVMIGTPEYMSPEQADLTGQDIDTRTDVYSLGVLLYQLLTGALPFDPKALRQAGFDEIRRVIREEEPSKPSKRLTTLDDASTESAARRRTDVATLSWQLRGDLDWITMRALEKDRTRRYQSPSDLAADIARHLGHDPVLASPPSAAYRAKKFIRRNRVGVGIATALAILLLGFAVAMTYQAARIARERDRADQEAESAERVATFLADMLSDVDPERLGFALMSDLRERVAQAEADRGSSETEVERAVETFLRSMWGVNGTDAALRMIDVEILERAGKTINDKLANAPTIAARLMYTLGVTYSSLGLWEQAQTYLEQAVEVRSTSLSRDHPETLQSQFALAKTLSAQGRWAQATDLVQHVWNERKRTLGEAHPETLRAMGEFADLQIRGSDQEVVLAAEAIHKAAIAISVRALGEDDPVTWELRSGLAGFYWGTRQLEKAEPLWESVYLSRQRTLGDDHLDTVETMNQMVLLYGSLHRPAEAVALCERVIEIQERKLGSDHPHTLWSKNNKAGLDLVLGRETEAEALHRDTVKTLRERLGDHHVYTWMSLFNFACHHVKAGNKERGIEVLGQAVEAGMRPKNLRNPCWKPLQGDPEFEAVVADLRKRLEEK